MKEERQNRNGFPRGFTTPHLLSKMSEDASILVAFSGGADSHALLHLLCRYSKVFGARIYAAHVNHGIRGAEADRDEAFCREISQNYGVTFFCERVDVPKIAKQTGKSVELAARDERYAFFSRLMKQERIGLLAVAHNANDNLETVIYNMTRGSGLSGLCGIPVTRECDGGLLIRPILSMTREDILDYCKEFSLDYVTDSTNADTEYTRNKIRSHIIPILKQINPSVERNVVVQSKILLGDSCLLDSLADEFLEKEALPDSSVPLHALNNCAPSIAARAIIDLYRSSFSSSLERSHVEDVISLCQKGTPHSRISLPEGAYAYIEKDSLFIADSYPGSEDIQEYFIEARDGENFISQTNCEIVIGSTQKKINIYKKSIQLSIDSAKINGALILRSRRPGDKILSGGMHKSVKKLMCDKKIPVDIRARLPIICDDSGIVAIPFVAVRDGCKAVKASHTPQGSKEINFYLY